MNKKNFFKQVVFLTFLIVIGKETQLAAQVGGYPHIPNFSNHVITTDCCPDYKRKLDSIMIHAPFVFEGRMIKRVYGNFYDSYLFEIEKVYKGGERLQSGTVEIVAKIDPREPPLAGFAYGWHIILAKETDVPGTFDANNSIKLELFHNDEFYTTSYFVEISDNKRYQREIGVENEPYYTSKLSLNYKTKEEVRDFLASYGLSPTDIPKADTVKTLSEKDKKIAKEKAIRAAEEKLKKAENARLFYQSLLENTRQLDSMLGKQTSRQAIEAEMNFYDSASQSERNSMIMRKRIEERQLMDSLSNRQKSQGQLRGRSSPTLTFTLQNVKNTENSDFFSFLKKNVILYQKKLYLCISDKIKYIVSVLKYETDKISNLSNKQINN